MIAFLSTTDFYLGKKSVKCNSLGSSDIEYAVILQIMVSTSDNRIAQICDVKKITYIIPVAPDCYGQSLCHPVQEYRYGSLSL